MAIQSPLFVRCLLTLRGARSLLCTKMPCSLSGYPFPMAREYNLEIAEIDATLVSIEKVLDLPKLEAEAVDLEAQAGVPNLWDDPEKAQAVTS